MPTTQNACHSLGLSLYHRKKARQGTFLNYIDLKGALSAFEKLRPSKHEVRAVMEADVPPSRSSFYQLTLNNYNRIVENDVDWLRPAELPTREVIVYVVLHDMAKLLE